MKLSTSTIDQSWLSRLDIQDADSDFIVSGCEYWKRADEIKGAFFYTSNYLTLVSCSDDIKKVIAQNNCTSVDELMQCREMQDVEIDTDDVDYYLFEPSALMTPASQIIELTLEHNRSEIAGFIKDCSEKDVLVSDFDIDSDHFYAAVSGQEIMGMTASYCGQEPFESLSIMVKEAFRGKGVGKALLENLVVKMKERNRFVRYRTNAENSASIKLCKSVGFSAYSKCQTISRKDEYPAYEV